MVVDHVDRSTGTATSNASTAGSGAGSSSRPAAFSLGHGGNDAQKTMGVILAVLIASRQLPANAERAALGRAVAPTPPSRSGTLDGRLAHREDDGLEDHPPAAGRRHVRRVGRGGDAVLHVGRGHPGVDDAHHHRRASSASVRASGSRRCGGASPAASCGPGCSPFPAPRSIAAVVVRHPQAVLMDRRALFFLGAAVVCLVLMPLTPGDLRWFAARARGRVSRPGGGIRARQLISVVGSRPGADGRDWSAEPPVM